jgi:hypothetical protein
MYQFLLHMVFRMICVSRVLCGEETAFGWWWGAGELSDVVASACPLFPHVRQALAGGDGMVSRLVWYCVLGVLISGREMLIWIVYSLLRLNSKETYVLNEYAQISISHRPRFKSRARLVSNSSS